MGQVSSQGLEGIAYRALPHLDKVNLTFDHEYLMEFGYNSIYGILRDNDLLPQLVPNHRKSNEASHQFRKDANERFVKFKDLSDTVIELYTKAVKLAEPGSTEMALAFASRSALLFERKEYNDSIKDIDRALAGNYLSSKPKLYLRRGKCHLALSQYSRALDDFNQAKSCLEGTADTKQNIESLIKQCLNKSDKPHPPSPDTITLSHPPSSYIQCASTAVDIKYSPELGRHVVAAADIKPGDVLAIEKPYAAVLRPAHTGNLLCDFCKMKSHSSVPCESCPTVVFCSEECRQSSWDLYHAIECGILATLFKLSQSNTVEGDVEMKTLTAVRLLNVASKGGKEMNKLMEALGRETASPESAGFVDGKYISDDYTAMQYLATNIESRSHQKLTEYAVYAVCLMHILKEGTEFFKNSDASVLSGDAVHESCSVANLSKKNLAAVDRLFKHLMMVHINGHSFGEMTWIPGLFPLGKSLGSAIFAFHSLFNHSCDPNVTHFTFRGDTFYTTAIQPIKKGQQIFEDYGYNYNAESLTERQCGLKKHYNFTCRCVACLNNWPSYEFLRETPLMKRAEARRSIMDYVRRFPDLRTKIFSGTGTDEDLELLSKFMILAQENVILPWRLYVDCQDTIKCYMSFKALQELTRKTPR